MTIYICFGKWAKPAFRISFDEMRLCLGFIAFYVGRFDVEDTTTKAIAMIETLKHEIDRLNKYAIRLLREESRTWVCPKCNTGWWGTKACDDDPMLCPDCETPMRPKSVVKDEEIEWLKGEIERLQH